MKPFNKEQYGRDFAPDCDFAVYSRNTSDWMAWISIGDFYYETDAYKDKQDAIDEQRGCLLAIKEQIEKYLATLDEVNPMLKNKWRKEIKRQFNEEISEL